MRDLRQISEDVFVLARFSVSIVHLETLLTLNDNAAFNC